MKILFCILLIPISCLCQTKDSLKYQIKINIYPIAIQQYSGAFNVGFETRQKKINYGVDWFSFNTTKIVQDKYRFDTLMHRKRIDSFLSTSGLAFNFSKFIKIKQTSNKLILGFQAIVGTNRYYSFTRNETYDSLRQKYNNGKFYTLPQQMQWQNDKDLNNGNIQNHLPEIKQYKSNLTLGIAIFCRLELLVYKRFIFSPELKIPVIYNNNNKYFNVDINPGLSFNLGYKFGKGKIRAKKKVKMDMN